jgi:hypothetical protein
MNANFRIIYAGRWAKDVTMDTNFRIIYAGRWAKDVTRDTNFRIIDAGRWAIINQLINRIIYCTFMQVNFFYLYSVTFLLEELSLPEGWYFYTSH